MNNVIETMKNIIDELNECTGPDALENFSKKIFWKNRRIK